MPEFLYGIGPKLEFVSGFMAPDCADSDLGQVKMHPLRFQSVAGWNLEIVTCPFSWLCFGGTDFVTDRLEN